MEGSGWKMKKDHLDHWGTVFPNKASAKAARHHANKESI